jgi:pimeloyl-ACP methyl ester carboxylesterase
MGPAPDPVLLIAGWGQPASFWDRFLPHINGTAAITVDNRETGTAGPCPGGFTIDELAADALEVMDRLGHHRFTVVGHSMGGMIAQALAFAAPERVDGLVLVSTRLGQSRVIDPDPAVLAPPQGLDLPEDPEQAAIAIRAVFYERYIAPGSTPPREQLAREEAARAQGAAADLEGLMRQWQALTTWEPPAALKELELTVAVVHGDADTLVPHGNGEIVADYAGVPLQTLPGVGHMVPWEAPADLAAVIAETRVRG